MKKKQLYCAFYLCMILVASLLFLHVIPEFSIGQLTFKKIDLLSDLKVFESEDKFAAAQDSIQVKQDSIIRIVEEHCRPGITCIEDYSADSSALKLFIRALTETRKNGKRLRIAFYGDSFIEGDVFCGSFRDTLQSLFGGRGVGYVPITSHLGGFRNTIRQDFSNWYTTSLVARKDSVFEVGPSGYSFVPLESNWVQFKASKQRFLNEFNIIKLYYTNYDDAAVHYTVDKDSLLNIDELKQSGSLQEWTFSGNKIKSIRFEFYPHDSLQLYGAAFESKAGVYVDNFSLRGNSGMSLYGINDKLLKKFSNYRDYKLVIIQFGLNIVTEDSLNYKAYTKRMVAVVKKFKKAFPNSSFLLLSVGDRSSNKSGKLRTMNAIPALRNAQREIAQQTKIGFWDMYEAMGGENSMVKFAQARPPLAAKDYTHLTFKGGKKLAGSLVKSLLFEAEKYEKRRTRKK